MGTWSVDAVEDLLNDAKRRDFVDFRRGNNGSNSNNDDGGDNDDNRRLTFKSHLANPEVSGGAHIGATTIVYGVPPGGWDDKKTPMRAVPGGYVDAVSGGKEKVEREIARDAGKYLGGYEVGVEKVRSGMSKDNENGDDGLAIEEVLEKIKLKRKKKSDIIGESLEVDGGLKLPIEKERSSRKHTVEKAAWEKGGMLPPRLYSEHDFREVTNDCELAVAEVPARRKKTQSVFNHANQQFDIGPLIRYIKNGSQITKFERGRLKNIRATKGRFGKTVEVDPNARTEGEEDPRKMLNSKIERKKLRNNMLMQFESMAMGGGGGGGGDTRTISDGQLKSIKKKESAKGRRMTMLIDGSLMAFKGA